MWFHKHQNYKLTPQNDCSITNFPCNGFWKLYHFWGDCFLLSNNVFTEKQNKYDWKKWYFELTILDKRTLKFSQLNVYTVKIHGQLWSAVRFISAHDVFHRHRARGINTEQFPWSFGLLLTCIPVPNVWPTLVFSLYFPVYLEWKLTMSPQMVQKLTNISRK